MSNFAWNDESFLNAPENIGLRFQCELSRPYQVLRDAGIKSTVSIFGSARISKDNPKNCHLWKYLDIAEEFSYRISEELSKPTNYKEFVIATGGGACGIMDVCNKGAYDADAPNIGFSIELPFETHSSKFITPEFDFNFKYFSLRKFHIMKQAKVIVAFPSGIGGVEELTEVLCLQQVMRMPKTPIILFGKEFWSILMMQLEYFHKNGLTNETDFSQILVTDSIDEGINYIKDFYKL